MNFPETGDFIDIHNHHAVSSPGIFTVESLMAHENLQPGNEKGIVYTAGIHPWYLDDHNQKQLLEFVNNVAGNSQLVAIGEAGFDKLRGPSVELQREIFEKQVNIANEKRKPVVIHCVRAWVELLAAHRKLKPVKPWLVHGFRGKKELALQLISRGMYLSFWFDFIIRQESAELLRSLPKSRIFLETDGADVNIRDIYQKVSGDLALSVDELKKIILENFGMLFVK
jgi:TatD DNase family protein